MSDWQVGDKALCIKSGIETREGRTYRVAAVVPPHSYEFGRVNRYDRAVLYFRGMAPPESGDGSDSDRFRKILPDKHEADETCPALLKLSKQRVSA